jgi:hypothetical protein
MNASSARFIERREQSKVYEIAFGAWLQSRAYYVLPTYDYSGLGDGKAPVLHTHGESLVIPDLLAWGKGNGLWFEVKLKDHAEYYYKFQHLTTGFSLRLYKHYRRVKEVTGLKVYVVFIHAREECVKYGEIDALPVSHSYTGDKMGRDGMIFFKFDEMTDLMPLSQLKAVAA